MVKIKLMGAKSRIAKDIVPIIQKCIDDNNLKTYIEPFVGGCNVIDKVLCEYKQGTDKNKYLIALFKRLQNNGNFLPKFRESYIQKSEQIIKTENMKIGMLVTSVSSQVITADGLTVVTLNPDMKRLKQVRDTATITEKQRIISKVRYLILRILS